MIFWTLLGSLGLGGVATVAGLFFFPTLTMQFLSGLASVVLGVASKGAAKFFSGCEWIFQRKDATFALFVFMLVAGIIAERYDPVGYLLHWTPGGETQAETVSERIQPKKSGGRSSAQRQARPVEDTLDYIRKSLNPF